MSAFSLDGKLSLDARSFQQGAKKAEQSVGDIGDAFGKLPKEAKAAGQESADGISDELGKVPDSGGKIGKLAGGKLGTGMIAAFGALGVGAVLMDQLSAAFDRADAFNVVKGKFALTAEEADRVGKLAGDLYAAGWGEGLDQVQEAAALSMRKLGDLTDDELASVTTSVLAVSKTWGEDFDAVVRSTNQLIQNDLAPNAEAALDLIVGAFQAGGNEAGDLLDTIDEYSQHWSAMGLSGEEALNQIIAGFQGGQRDADKMADAVKEMGIRIREGAQPVREALEDIGLDADDVIDAFVEGGPAAHDAFLKVIAALQDGEKHGNITKDAVALIGTQFEDLGPQALEALGMVDGALEDTTGKAKALAEQVEATPWERLQRRGETTLGTLGDIIARKIYGPLDSAANLMDQLFGTDIGGAEFGGKIDTEALDDVKSSADGATTAVGGTLYSIMDLVDEIALYGSESASAADDVDELIGSSEELQAQTDALVESILGYITAQRRAADSTIDAREAQFDFNDTLDDANTVLGDANSNLVDVARAQDDVARAAGRNADAQVQLAIDTNTANGKVTSAAEQQDVWNESMLRSAAQAKGPLRQSILDYIGTVNDIPESTLTEIEAALNAGDVVEAERILNDTSRTRTAAIEADAKTDTAESSLAWLARDRTTRVWAVAGTRVAMASGGVAAGGITLVGEQGPELVNLPKGSRVYTATETRAMLAQSAQPAVAPIRSMTTPVAAAGSDSGDVIVNVAGSIYGDAHLRKVLDDSAKDVAAAVRAGRRV